LIISGQDEWLRKAAGRLAAARGLNVITDMSKPINIGELRVALTSLTAAGASPANV